MHRRFLLSGAAAAWNAAVLTSIRAAAQRPLDLPFATFLALVTLFCMIEGALADETPRTTNNLGTLATLTGIAIFATFAIAIVSDRSLMPGAFVMAAGIALRCVAVYTLGARFVSELRADEPLIRRGVYRWLDHPSEIGLLTLTLGACVLMRSVAALAIWIIGVLPLTIARMQIENAFLRHCRARFP